MDWIEAAENLQLRCFDRCALISASHTNLDIFETAICFLLIRACGRAPKPLWIRRTSEDTVFGISYYRPFWTVHGVEFPADRDGEFSS